MTELTKKISLALIEYYDIMKNLDKISDRSEREGKKVAMLTMTCNDLEKIFEESVEDLSKI